MKKIVIVNQDSGYLMIDIANGFAADGFEVTLITGRLVERNTALHEGIELLKIMRYRRNNILNKVLSWFIGILQILTLLLFKYRSHYLLIVSNPPFAPLLPLVIKNQYSLLIYDVYIEIPEQFTLFKSRSLLVRLWKKAHIKVLRNAGIIFSLTKGMSSLIEKYSQGKKCEIVPIWTDNEFLKPIPADNNPFIKEHQLQEKFIVLYSGSIGETSGIEYLIDVASIIDNEQIVFLIIGEGSKKQSVARKIRELKLNNCVLLPWQEVRVLPYSLASASVAVVMLDDKSSKSAIPSKLFNYLSVGAPILCLADPASDLGELIEKEKIGKCFRPHKKEDIAAYIDYLFRKPTIVEEIGFNSQKLSKHYSKENAYQFVTRINDDLK